MNWISFAAGAATVLVMLFFATVAVSLAERIKAGRDETEPVSETAGRFDLEII